MTFPIPGVPGATATATLDAKYMAERVVVTQGSTTTRVHLRRLPGLEQPAEQDRGVLRRQDGRAPERRGRPRPDDDADGDGQRVCGGAGAGERAGGDESHGDRLPHGVLARTEPPIDKSAPTPRMGAHPDLTGNWSYSDWIGNYMTGGGRRCGPTQTRRLQPARPIRPYDFELYSPSRFGNRAARSTSRSTGTRFSSSTCGRTRKTRS